MVEIVEKNLKFIIDACRMHHVKSLFVFGSAARVDEFTDKSDLDFLVDFSLPVNSNEEVFYKVENQKKLHEKLEEITKRKIDLIQERNIKNKYLKYYINKDKKLIYGLS